MADLTIGFDPGSSLSKLIYKLPSDDNMRLLVMEPEVIKLPRESIDAYLAGKGEMGVAKSSDEAWVECTNTDECYAVGFLARYFSSLPRLDRLKYETALYKVLGAVGAIAEQAHLPSKLSIAIACLLPYGEYQDRERFEKQLRQHLRNFVFRGKRLRVKLEKFECRPEGGGLAMSRLQQNGLEWFQRQKLAVLMFGHRNTSLLLFERGKLTKGDTSNLGFHQLVDKIIGRTSGQATLSLTSAIYELGSDIRPENRVVRSLVKSTEARHVDAEIKQIAKVIATARVEYWLGLENWLDSILPTDLNEVILSGGAALYLQPELTNYFNRTSVYWGMDLQEQVKEALREQRRSRQSGREALSFRLVDVYGMFADFRERVEAVT